MDVLIHIFIFLIVLLLYLHISAQYKVSEDLEVYEMDYTNNKQLQEVCDLKQPILFLFRETHPEFFNDFTIDDTNRNEVYVKDIHDYYVNNSTIDSLLLPYQTTNTLMKTDSKSTFFSETNHDFIDESNLTSLYETNDAFLKPSMTAVTKYDIVFGSRNCVTPFRYHNHYRHFLCVQTGKLRVKMSPFKTRKYTPVIKDYDNYEFRTEVNVWKDTPPDPNIEKVKFLEFDVQSGFVLYIPSYWFYSIQFVEENTVISTFTYDSYMNYIANLPDLARFFIQQQNTKKKVTKTVPLHVANPTDASGNSIPITHAGSTSSTPSSTSKKSKNKNIVIENPTENTLSVLEMKPDRGVTVNENTLIGNLPQQHASVMDYALQ